jgi:hypothetical protein
VGVREADGWVGMIDAGWLRGLGEEGLASLLRRRPEVLAPPVPASLAELAERLGTPGSVLAALRRLDRPTLHVAEAIAALGGQTDRMALDRLLGATDADTVQAVSGALDTLRGNALLAVDPALILVPAGCAAWPRPLGLGPAVADMLPLPTADDLRAFARNLGIKPATRKAALLAQVTAALRDPDTVCATVDQAPAPVRDLLYKVAATGEAMHDFDYYSPRYGQVRTPVQWAVARGMLVRASDWDSGLVMPAEVALALRGPAYTAPFDLVPPTVDRAPADTRHVAEEAAAAGSAMVRLVADLLEEAGRAPLATLRAGGVGTREVRRLTKHLTCAELELRLALALAGGAGLLSTSDGQATPTGAYDQWLRGEPAQRLAELLTAWWHLPYVPLVSDGAWNPHEHAPGSQTLRAALIRTAAQPEATAVRDPGGLVALTIWTEPYNYGDPDTAPARALSCWREAGLLGVAAAGAVSPAGHALLDDTPDLAAVLGDVGNTQQTVRLQADLTAIVAGTPAPNLAALLDTAADPETRGTAYTWRFSPDSIRRALDAGHTPITLLADLTAAATGTLPQPLEYLITDTARRHGTVRARTVVCCLRSDDTALLTEIAANRSLRNLGLRHLAPTVLAADQPLPDTLAALRKAGYAPVAETNDGTSILERPTAHRTTTPTSPKTKRAKPTSTARHHVTRTRTDPTQIARALLSAPDNATAARSASLPLIRAAAINLSTAEARVLAHAIDNNLPVAIEYTNRDGNPSSRVIDHLELSGNSLYAWCRLREDHRWFTLTRIAAVEPVRDLDE